MYIFIQYTIIENVYIFYLLFTIIKSLLFVYLFDGPKKDRFLDISQSHYFSITYFFNVSYFLQYNQMQ